MRLLRSAAGIAALTTFLLTACGGSSSATTTPVPPPTTAPTTAPTQAAAAASSGSPVSGTAAACPTTQAGNAPAFGNGLRATGMIATINGTSFTVTERNNTSTTVMTDANTRYQMLAPSSVSAVAVGDFVTAQGATIGNSVAVTTITDMGSQNAQGGAAPAGGNGQRPGARAGCPPPGAGQQAGNGTGNGAGGGFIGGTVQQVDGTTITIGTVRGGTMTLTTDANTKVMQRQQGQFSDLKVGDQVMAMAARGNGNAVVNPTPVTSFTAALVTDDTAH